MPLLQSRQTLLVHCRVCRLLDSSCKQQVRPHHVAHVTCNLLFSDPYLTCMSISFMLQSADTDILSLLSSGQHCWPDCCCCIWTDKQRPALHACKEVERHVSLQQ